jgi:hypothetical protein
MARHRFTRAVVTGTLAAFAALALPSTAAAQSDSVPAKPLDPVTAIVEAFRNHDIVALSDAHGNVQSQNFLKTLIRDPRFASVANDIVIEFGNARYQDVVDRFVRARRLTSDRFGRRGRTQRWPTRYRLTRNFSKRFEPSMPRCRRTVGCECCFRIRRSIGPRSRRGRSISTGSRCATRIRRRSCRSRCWPTAPRAAGLRSIAFPAPQHHVEPRDG